jgi:HAD superfamily hydrolase (TIGR01549 family)
MKKLLIFDYDGVFVDTLDVMTKVINKLIKNSRPKNPLSKEEVAKIFDVNFYEGMKNLCIEEKVIKNYSKEAKEFIKCRHEIKAFEGIIEVIKKLSKQNIIVIVSSNTDKVIETFLKDNKLESYIEEIIGIEKEVSKVKKIEYCKRKYNFENDFIFYIGDTTGDVIEGKKAQVKTVVVTWGFHDKKKLEKENPDFIVEKPEDLLKLFL